MLQMFKYEAWPQSTQDTLSSIDNFIDGDFHTKKRETNNKILLYAFLLSVRCIDNVQCVCAQMVAVLRTETFITFHLTPFFFQE